ncbi:MAG: PEP-CTERM sorting domain-containing protein, partial [Pirellulales bacterium]|nr:PEP-CTERM sorting domain-containing protein [Pirellulales bacterium]
EIIDIPGDFNNDGKVDSGDLATWRSGYGTIYDGSDLLTWQRNYQGETLATAAAVPEPGSLGLLLLGIVGSLGQSRKMASRVAAQRT